MNRNDLADQTISVSASSFDRATFKYDVVGYGLIEVVDNIRFAATPEPGTLLWFGFASTLVLLQQRGKQRLNGRRLSSAR